MYETLTHEAKMDSIRGYDNRPGRLVCSVAILTDAVLFFLVRNERLSLDSLV